jgi:O-6-methylguanine DNA methyltransferase
MTLMADLRRLGEAQAPPSLRPAVLEAAGVGDRYAALDTVLGTFYVAFNRNGISAVMRAESGGDFEAWFQREFGRQARPGELPAGLLTRPKFDLRGLTPFERAVLRKTSEIPAGEVRTYSWVAREIGNPDAVRAVGSALARNPIPIVIPCHRVVRTDGTIGEYGAGGPEAKRTILAAEGAEPDRLLELARRGVRFQGSDSTHIFCFPTCRHARRIGENHRVGFRTEREAVNAGYRPCHVCRPAALAS